MAIQKWPGLGMHESVCEWRAVPYHETARRMMRQCLADSESQHLMVIAPDEMCALNFIFDGVLQRKDTEIFIGSSFQGDNQSMLYILQVLSRIRLCMEMGRTVVLLNLGCLYESLYEVLNQQYTYFNGRPTCRVALG